MRKRTTIAATVCAMLLAGCDHSWRHEYYLINRSDHPVVVEHNLMGGFGGHREPDMNIGTSGHRITIAPRSGQMFAYYSEFLGRPMRAHYFPLRVYQGESLIYSQDSVTEGMWDIEDHFFRTSYTVRVFDVQDPRREGYERDPRRLPRR